MTFQQVSESTLLYSLVAIGILLVLAASIYYLVVCYKHAISVGVSKTEIRSVIKSSISFSIVPSIAIVAGLVSLVAVIGIPYAWLRLSVIGSVAYELMASGMAMSALGVSSDQADASTFGLMMWAMCLPMTIGIAFNIFIVKPIHMGTVKLGAKDKRWGPLSQTVFMTTLLVTLVVPMFAKGAVYLLTFGTSAVIALSITFIAARTRAKWLTSFTLALSLIGAMMASVLFDSIFS